MWIIYQFTNVTNIKLRIIIITKAIITFKREIILTIRSLGYNVRKF